MNCELFHRVCHFPRGFNQPCSYSWYISHTRDSVSSGKPNTEKRIKNRTSSEVVLTNVQVFEGPIKQCLECLMDLLDQKKDKIK